MAGGTECSSKPEGRRFERCFSLVISNNFSAGPKQELTARKLLDKVCCTAYMKGCLHHVLILCK